MSTNLSEVLTRILGAVEGDRVLDLATGEGGFVRLLVDDLGSYRQILGVDAAAPSLARARRTFKDEAIHFLQMDAEKLGLADESVDTVTLSAVLHHLPAVGPVLAEVRRVLCPGGHLVLAEMHRDGQTPAQRTAVQMHHWVARLDAARGVSHNPTLAREDLVRYIRALHLRNAILVDVSDVEVDPLAGEVVRRAEDAIDRYLERARGLPESDALRREGMALRRRVHEVGVHREPVLVVVGRK
jgi:ubiquinone/menaquinone biosynthesis C-methylase UbiE